LQYGLETALLDARIKSAHDGTNAFHTRESLMPLIYKIVPEKLWREAETQGAFAGSPVDLADGFIHFSTAAQARETAAKHFAGQEDLLLAAIDPVKLGGALRYEPSRGGALFPHLYAPLPLSAVIWVKPLPLGADGHLFPDDLA
jgi:uncharacterized protein (DUF952 family)